MSTSIFAQSLVYGQPKSLSTSDNNLLATKVQNYSTFSLHPLSLWAALQYNGQGLIGVSINTGDGYTKFLLRKSSVFSPDAKMTAQSSSGVQMYDLRGDGLYRGYANGDTTQVAAFLIQKDHFSGYFRLDGKFWQIDQVGSLSTDLQGDVSTIYAKYEHAITPSVECASTFVEARPTDAVEPREGMMRHLELAYEVDGEMYAQLGSETAVKDYVSQLALQEEKRYVAVSMAFKFHIVHINIWKDAATDPYSGTAVQRWMQLKNWWQAPANGKGCIQRDAVTMLSGASTLDANGFVDYAGVASICGSPLGFSCTWFPYSVVHYSSVLNFDANKAAHELAHNFGVGHKCLCGLMLSSDACGNGTPNGTPYPSCPSASLDRFDTPSGNRIRSYFAGTFQTCKNDVTSPSDACMLYAPPVDMGFQLTLTSDQVIMTDVSILCLDSSLSASFYNNYDPNGSLFWSLGPLLAFDDNAPANSLTRKVKVAGPGAICSPFDSWVEVSFNYGCGGPPVTYRRQVRLGSTFGLDGTYTGTGGPSKTIGSVNNGTQVQTISVQKI